MKIFNGNEHAKVLDKKIEEYLSSNPNIKTIAIVLIGNDSASEKYVGIKGKLCKKLGIPIQVHRIDKDLPDEKILNKVSEIFSEEKVGGGIIQLPLPRESLRKVLDIIPLDKDIDLISPKVQKNYYAGDFSRLSPVVRAFEYFRKENKIDLKSLDACVIGDGYLVGKPIAHYLKQKNVNVTLLSNYKKGCKLNYHLLILSAGISSLVKGHDIVKGCHILDYGSSIVDGKVKGDLDLDSVLTHLGTISPSPGGVGPLVTRFLLLNFLHI